VPSEDDIYAAVVPSPTARQPYPGLTVDLVRLEAERARRAGHVFRTLPYRWPYRVVEAQPPKPREATCPVCCVALVTTPGAGTRCPYVNVPTTDPQESPMARQIDNAIQAGRADNAESARARQHPAAATAADQRVAHGDAAAAKAAARDRTEKPQR